MVKITPSGAGGGFLVKMAGRLFRRSRRGADDAGGRVTKRLVDGMPPSGPHPAHRQIDDALARVNPKYRRGQDPYTQNCTSVAVALELRRRGLDVTAGPLEKHRWLSQGGIGGRPTLTVVKDVFGRDMITADRDAIVRAFEQAGDGARGIVRIRWNGGGGHAFNVENVGGQVRFIDGQPPGGVRDASHYFDRGSDTMYARVDDVPTPGPDRYGPYIE